MPGNNEETPNPATSPEPDNYGLPANFVPIDVPPIIPSNGASGGSNPFGGGSIPQNMSLQPDFINTLYPGGAVPTVRLMPVQGAPSTNAQSQSVAEKVVNEVINSTTNSSGEFVSLQTNSVINAEQDVLNLENGTNTTAVYVGAGAVQINTSAHEIAVNGVAAAGSEINLNGATPAPAAGTTNVVFQSNGATPETSVSAYMPVMIGDSGSGGTSGAVPAPPSGSFAAGKYLTAGGTYAIPPGTGGAAYYQEVETAGSPVTQQPILNFLAPFGVANNSGNTSTDISITIPAPIYSFTNQYLGSPVSVSANTPTTIDNIAVTFPASGGPWYVRISYYYNKSGGVNFIGYAEDSTAVTPFATCQGVVNASRGAISASGLSPNTYANGVSRTFNVRIEDTGSTTIETDSSGAFTTAAKSYLQIEIIPVN